MTPVLSVDYRSGGGSGLFGRGWNLSGVPGFSMHTAHGLPRYDGADTYSYAGSGELVAYATEAGEAWEERGGFRVLRYRSRFERSFMRIERWVEKTTGRTHWRTRDARNTLTLYGLASDGLSRVADPADPSRVFSWQPELQIDAFGNAIEFQYLAEDFVGVDPGRPEESARVRSGVLPAQRYLKRMRWGNVKPLTVDGPTPAGQRWCFELVFDFSDHDPAAPKPTADRPWGPRPDAYSTYIPGFEMRVYRLCRRLLLYHHFPELDVDAVLVHTYAFDYDLKPEGSTLSRIRRTGYRKDGATKERPPLVFDYTKPQVGRGFKPAPQETLETLPQGLDGANYRLIDLYGEGLAGLLIDDGRAWLYKPNEGGGRFGLARTVVEKPAHSIAAVSVQDFDSDGNADLTVMGGRGAGYYAFDRQAGAWGGFTPFASMPHVEAAGGFSQWLDLSGDGLADIVLGGPDRLTWYRSRGRAGFDAGIGVQPARSADSPLGLSAPWRDAPGLDYFFADMSGDGLLDQVVVRNGLVAYWPNLGHGRFGAPVVMDGAPRFAADGEFDAGRLLFADLDGTGCTDLLYLGHGEITYWINAGGNALLSGRTMRGLPHIDIRSSIRILDFLGDGTPCLVWSARSGANVSGLHYLPLTDGIKPGLLQSMHNSMGMERRIAYGTSAAHYLRDRQAGRAWRRKLPRHTVVVDRVELIDQIAANRAENIYRYHDGSYDGRERMFRGFGFVELLDSEVQDDAGQPLASTAPSCVRSWYHLGAEAISSRDLMWAGDPSAPAIAPYIFEGSDALAAAEAEDALFSVAGIAVRTETFAVKPDGSLADTPFRVEDNGVLIRRIQPAFRRSRASFAVFSRETVSAIYEQQPDDARILHQFNLETDAFGATRLTADVAYPRRAAFPVEHPSQSKLHCILHRTKLAHVDLPDRVELSIALESESFDVPGLAKPAAGVFTWAEIKTLAATALAAPVTHEVAPVAAGVAQRLSWARSFYWDGAGTAALAHGQTASPLRLHHSETAAFTPDFVTTAFDGKVGDARLAACFYRKDANHWWRIGETFSYGTAANFRRLESVARPDGGITTFQYDAASMTVVETADALGNRTRLTFDYHLLAPVKSVDPNDNVSETRFDALGMAVAWSMSGEALDDGGTARQYGFDALSSLVLPANATAETAIADPAAHVGKAAQVMFYDANRWVEKGEPPLVVSISRDTLHFDGEGGTHAAGETTVTVGHMDGFGRTLQEKILVEPGDAVKRGAGGTLEIGADGQPVMAAAAERWRVGGHTLYNRKQQPIRSYEPYFSTLWRFEPEAELAAFGAFHAYLYDALGRTVRHDEPNGAFSRVEHGIWSGRTFDPNDTVEQSVYRISRQGLPAGNPERLAYENAKAHADTPAVSIVDPAGRTVATVESSGDGQERKSVTTYGADGEISTLVDARGITVLTQSRDMLGRVVRTTSPDGGTDMVFSDGLDRPVDAWNERGVHMARNFDTLDRLLDTRVDGLPGLDRMVESIVYGEDASIPNAKARNLLGRMVLHRDEAGTRTVERCNILGKVLASTQRVIDDPKTAPDWSTPATVALLPDQFKSRVIYDGLGRAVQQDLPDGASLGLTYIRGGGLKTVTASTADGLVSDLAVIDDAAFNARGQRQTCRLGNGVDIAHAFDPQTWRTTNVKAGRGGATPATLQDLDYAYDPVGNIVYAVDRVHQPGAASPFITGVAVAAERSYKYDGFYQIREAAGRVHKALLPSDHRTDAPNAGSVKGTRNLSFNDGGLLERYSELFTYDLAGNMTSLQHKGTAANWTNEFWISATSNRALPALDANGLPVSTPEDQFDAAGNALRFPHLAGLSWSYRNTLEKAVIIDRTGSGQPDDAEYYVYDASGQRIRKRTERLIAAGVVEATDVLYLDGCEIKRISRGATLVLERRTTHVSDGFNRVAEIHRWNTDSAARETDDVTKPRMRYQLADHLGSAVMQLDEAGKVISYEEYLPFGGSAFIAGSDQREVEMRSHRFSGKECDDGTGLYCFGHRYYAPWMCRWISADPVGIEDGLNLYLYVHNNPMTYFDPDGLQTAQKRGKEVPVAGAVPLKVHEAFASLPAERQAELKKLMANKNFSWFMDGTSGQVYFGTRSEIRTLAEAKLGAGENVGALTAPPANPNPNAKGGQAGAGGKKKAAKPPKAPPPPSNDNGGAPGKGGKTDTGTGGAGKGGSNDAAGGDDGSKGGAKDAKGEAGDSTGKGNSQDPGGASANPGDGGVPGGTGGDGKGLGTKGDGTGGGGTATDPKVIGSGKGEGSGTGAGKGDGDADKGAGTDGAGADGKGGAKEGSGEGTGVDDGGAPGGVHGGTGKQPGSKSSPGGTGKPGGAVGGKPGTDPKAGADKGAADGSPEGNSDTGKNEGAPGNNPTPTGDPNGRRNDAGSGTGGNPNGNPNAQNPKPGGGGQSGGEKGSGKPSDKQPPPKQEKTIMDHVVKVAGYWNLEFGDGAADGAATGGVPGAFGTHNWGGWGQAIYVALTVADIVVTFLSLGGTAGIKAGFKAVMAAGKKAASSIAKKAAEVFAEKEGVKIAQKASIRTLFQGAKQAAKGAGSKFWNWFNFLKDKGGATIPNGEKKILGFWPSISSTITNLETKGTAAYIDTAVHEGVHKFLYKFLGPLTKAQGFAIKGKPVGAIFMWAEETVAYALGRASVGRVHGLVIAPLEAFNSVFSNYGGGAAGRSAVRWAVGELAAVGAGIGGYLWYRGKQDPAPPHEPAPQGATP